MKYRLRRHFDRRYTLIFILSLLLLPFQNCAPPNSFRASDGSSSGNAPSGTPTDGQTTTTTQVATSTTIPVTTTTQAVTTTTRTSTTTTQVTTTTLPGSVTLPAGKTYYIRADGGNKTQCDGKSDAAYPGSGSNQACAWKHPFYAFPPKDSSMTAVAGGSAVIIKNGEYKMGYGGIPDSESGCASSYPWDCSMRALPSGTSSAPTMVIGESYFSGCGTKPKLWGTQRAGVMFNLTNSNYVQLRCLEITDKEDCIESYGPNTADRCERNTFPYGDWISTGIYAQDSANVLLANVNIHGLANTGIHAGRLTNWTIQDTNIDGNGWVGWNGDIGAEQSSNSGTIYFLRSTIEWNGCIERLNGSHDGCWGQESSGYGDGLGTHHTEGNWIFDQVTVQYNTSDGIDMLYLNGAGTVTVKNSWVGHNAGNQVKTGRAGLIENNVIIGDCAFHEQFSTMKSGDLCRALGNALSLNITGGTTVRNNSVVSEGDCVVLSAGTGTLTLENNIFDARVDWRQSFENSCGQYHDTGTLTKAFTGNIFYRAKEGCPSGQTCVDPQFTEPTFEIFNPALKSGSPANGKGPNLSLITPLRN